MSSFDWLVDGRHHLGLVQRLGAARCIIARGTTSSISTFMSRAPRLSEKLGTKKRLTQEKTGLFRLTLTLKKRKKKKKASTTEFFVFQQSFY